MKDFANKIVVISGPTASGKTDYSISFAKQNNGIIINADSMQIYKGLPILSTQPTIDDIKSIQHLLFSYFEPYQICNVGLWLKLVKEKIDYCFENNKVPIVVGGTGMYISKLISGISQIPEVDQTIRDEVTKLYEKIGYDEFRKQCSLVDENYINKLNLNDKQRLMRFLEIYKATGYSIKYFLDKGNKEIYPKDRFFHINININREILYKRCEYRFKKMVENKIVIDEIKNFMNKYSNIIDNINEYSISKTIGLKDGIKYINNEITFDQFVNNSIKLTKNYAKRQYTWFNNQFDRFDLIIDPSIYKNDNRY